MAGIVIPNAAMVLAAGRGERLRPLTDATPKPLIEVGGRALIDHALDGLASAGVELAVVNLWYRADSIARHLAGRRRPRIVLSREDELLDTGGGVAKALPRLGSEPFYVLGSDGLWNDGDTPALERLAGRWDDAAMDALLLLQPMEKAVGFTGAGDFFIEPTGRLRRRGGLASAPYAFTSIQIMHPRAFGRRAGGAFSNNLIWDRALESGRLYGLEHVGDWCHVGTPEGLAEAKSRPYGPR